MPRAGHGAAHPVGVSFGALRTVGRLHRVDVEVDRADMVRIPRQHAFERRHDRRTLRLGLTAARLPIIPRAQIHQRFGMEHRDVVVVRELCRDLAHGGRVGRVERRAVGLRVCRVAGCERGDQGLLTRRGLAGERLRVADGGVGRRDRVLLHRHIDVRSEHQCLAPEAHRAIRIEPLRLAQSAPRLVVIERVGEAEPLIKIRLGLRIRRGHGVTDRTEPIPERRFAVGKLWRRHDRRQCAWRHFDLREAQQPGRPPRR